MTIKSAKKPTNIFHPNELLFCGYSNSGKTTLIKNLIKKLNQQFRIGYAKHDVHSFSVDHEGKDTHTIMKSGASAAIISDQEHWALMGNGQLDIFNQHSAFTDCDFVLVEGYKSLPLPKIVVLDRNFEILNLVRNENLEKIMAFVGFTEARPREIPSDTPYFYRDDIDAISSFTVNLLRNPDLSQTPQGLVLAGGYSRRMKKDKAQLEYFGKPQVEFQAELVSQLTSDVYVSARAGQWQGDSVGKFSIINDRFVDMGPIGGILSAMMAFPEKSWLVVACDLPLVNEATLSYLLSRRDPFKLATSYIDSQGLPEPLCAIYESRMKKRLLEALGLGIHCPRKVMLKSSVKLIEQVQPGRLANINYEHEYIAVKKQLSKELSL